MHTTILSESAEKEQR